MLMSRYTGRHRCRKSRKALKPWVWIGALVIVLAAFGVTQAQENKPQPPATPSVTFEAEPDRVWEHLLQVVQDKELPVASADKASGKLSTATKRYFRILSASFPPIQHDYRDTYTIEVLPANAGTSVKIQRKFETYDDGARNWVEKDPSKSDVGVSVEDLFEAVRQALGSLPENPG